MSFKASIVDREGVRSLLIPSNALFSHLTFQWIRENTLCFITDVFISPPRSIYWEMSGLAHSLEDIWAMVTLVLNLQLPYPPPSYCLTSAGAQGHSQEGSYPCLAGGQAELNNTYERCDGSDQRVSSRQTCRL